MSRFESFQVIDGNVWGETACSYELTDPCKDKSELQSAINQLKKDGGRKWQVKKDALGKFSLWTDFNPRNEAQLRKMPIKDEL